MCLWFTDLLNACNTEQMFEKNSDLLIFGDIIFLDVHVHT